MRSKFELSDKLSVKATNVLVYGMRTFESETSRLNKSWLTPQSQVDKETASTITEKDTLHKINTRNAHNSLNSLTHEQLMNNKWLVGKTLDAGLAKSEADVLRVEKLNEAAEKQNEAAEKLNEASENLKTATQTQHPTPLQELLSPQIRSGDEQ